MCMTRSSAYATQKAYKGTAFFSIMQIKNEKIAPKDVF